MDLANLNLTEQADKGAWLVVTHPVTGADTDIRIKLAGTDSQRWQKAERAFTNKRLAQLARKGNLTMSAEEVEARGVALLAAVTLEWEGLTLNGQVWQCSEENAKQLYRTQAWIREQADSFVAERANFFSSFDPVEAVEAVEGNSESGQSGASASA